MSIRSVAALAALALSLTAVGAAAARTDAVHTAKVKVTASAGLVAGRALSSATATAYSTG